MEFIFFLQSELSTSSGSLEPPWSLCVLTEIEKNAVRYTADYVVRKLEGKYSRRKTKAAVECLAALQEMGGKLRHWPSGDKLDQSSLTKWSQLVDRGGLYFVQDEVFDLFIMIKLIVDSKLDKIYGQGGQGIEQVKRENLSWVCEDEDVKSVWSFICPNAIEEGAVWQDLLSDIAFL